MKMWKFKIHQSVSGDDSFYKVEFNSLTSKKNAQILSRPTVERVFFAIVCIPHPHFSENEVFMPCCFYDFPFMSSLSLVG